jgi:hypothetical protein
VPPVLASKAVGFWPHSAYVVGGRRIAYRVLVGKPVENGPLARPRLRCEDDSVWNLKTGMRGCEWIDLAEDCDKLRAVVQTLKKLRISYFTATVLKS